MSEKEMWIGIVLVLIIPIGMVLTFYLAVAALGILAACFGMY